MGRCSVSCVMTSLRLLALAGVLFVGTACTSSESDSAEGRGDRTSAGQTTSSPVSGPSPRPKAAFEIAYEPDEYDAEVVETALARCARLPGAERAHYQVDTLPPTDYFIFSGSSSDKQAVEECLRSIPSAIVSVR